MATFLRRLVMEFLHSAQYVCDFFFGSTYCLVWYKPIDFIYCLDLCSHFRNWFRTLFTVYSLLMQMKSCKKYISLWRWSIIYNIVIRNGNVIQWKISSFQVLSGYRLISLEFHNRLSLNRPTYLEWRTFWI